LSLVEKPSTRFTPTRVGKTLPKSGLFWGFYQQEAFVVHNRTGGVSVGKDGVALFVLGVVDEEAASLAGMVAGFVPEAFSHESGEAADENSRFGFEHPAGQFAAQAGGHIFKD
jgi:hypothetical protein